MTKSNAKKKKWDDNDVDGDIKQPRLEAAIIDELRKTYANGNWKKLLRQSTMGECKK